MDQQDNFATILAAGAAQAAPHAVQGSMPYVLAPQDYELRSLEHLMPFPLRKRGKVTTTDSKGFIFYTAKHGNRDSSVIYADIDAEASKFNLVCVLNDHSGEADGQDWKDHLCIFTPTQAIEWRRWVGHDRKQFSQAEFAAWLEDNLADVATVDGMPTGADILQMSLGFEATADKRLRSKLNLQSGGTQFEYVDDEDKDTRTRMQVFERFTLGLPVFDGSTSAYPIEARLKYREKDGRMIFWYELIRPDRVFKTAVQDELALISTETGFAVVAGRP